MWVLARQEAHADFEREYTDIYPSLSSGVQHDTDFKHGCTDVNQSLCSPVQHEAARHRAQTQIRKKIIRASMLIRVMPPPPVAENALAPTPHPPQSSPHRARQHSNLMHHLR